MFTVFSFFATVAALEETFKTMKFKDLQEI